MANASRDQNNIPGILAALNTDGVTLTRVLADSVTHAIRVADGTTGTDHGTVSAKRDQNSVTGWMGVSSVDGVTPVPIYADSDGNLLVDSN